MQSIYDVAILLPTFNEAGNIINLIKEISKELLLKKITYKILVIDDNSSDKTGFLAKKYFAKEKNIQVVIRRNDRGLATAIKHGIKLAQSNIIIVMDTDFNHEPKLISKLIDKCSKYDFVIGSRYIKGGGMENKVREKLSLLFNIFLRIILLSPVHDNLSGFFAIKKAQLDKINLDTVFVGYGEYFIKLIYLAKLQSLTFAEIPCFYRNRQYGCSKSKFFTMFKDYLKTALALRFTKS